MSNAIEFDLFGWLIIFTCELLGLNVIFIAQSLYLLMCVHSLGMDSRTCPILG